MSSNNCIRQELDRVPLGLESKCQISVTLISLKTVTQIKTRQLVSPWNRDRNLLENDIMEICGARFGVLWVKRVLSYFARPFLSAMVETRDCLTECSLGIRDRRILRLLHRILRLNLACFLTELRPSRNNPPVNFQCSPASPILNETPGCWPLKKLDWMNCSSDWIERGSWINWPRLLIYSLGISSNNSLFFLSSCWLFIIQNRIRVLFESLFHWRDCYS